jgi:hypothetical protein
LVLIESKNWSEALRSEHLISRGRAQSLNNLEENMVEKVIGGRTEHRLATAGMTPVLTCAPKGLFFSAEPIILNDMNQSDPYHN